MAETLKSDSELCPRLDKIIASELVDPKHLTSSNEFGLEFQAYLEECAMDGTPARGRYMINMLAKTFDLDKHRGALLTQLQVLQIPLEGFSVPQLTTFRQKVTYALNSVPKSDRPNDRLLGEWLYQRLKGCKRLEYELRQIKESKPKSVKRQFPWLWRRLRDSLLDSKEDANAQAVDGALKAGPSAAAKVGGAVGKAANRGEKRKRAKKERPKTSTSDKIQQESSSSKADATAAAAKPFKKFKRKSTAKMTPEQKAKTPCVFHFKFSNCKSGADCAFSHNPAHNNHPPKKAGFNAKGPPPKQSYKASPKVSGGAALISG